MSNKHPDDSDSWWLDLYGATVNPGDNCPVTKNLLDDQPSAWRMATKNLDKTEPAWKWGNSFDRSVCECGSATVYGKDTNLHSDWCPRYKK